MRIIRSCAFLLALFCTAFAPALAQDKYPNRPVHFIVSFAAGGSNDIIARVLCEWLSQHLGRRRALQLFLSRAFCRRPRVLAGLGCCLLYTSDAADE